MAKGCFCSETGKSSRPCFGGWQRRAQNVKVTWASAVWRPPKGHPPKGRPPEGLAVVGSEQRDCCLAKFCFSFGAKEATTLEGWCYAFASLFCEMKELAARRVLGWRSWRRRTYLSAKALLQNHGEETTDVHARRVY